MLILVMCHPLGGKGRKREPGCSLECKYLNSDDYKDLLWTTLSEFPGTPLNYNAINISFLSNVWQAKRKCDECIDWCITGLLVTLWAIDRLGRRKTMALCFFVFSLCIVPLYGCVGRSESTSITDNFSKALKPVLISNVNTHLHLHVM